LQQGLDGYSGAEDTYMYRYAPDVRYTTDSVLRVGTKQQYASLLRFDLSSIPTEAVVVRAALQLYGAGWGGINVGMGAHVISRTVTVGEVTWNRAQEANRWGEAGCTSTVTDRRGLYESPVMTSGTGKWYSFPVSSAVQQWVDGTLANNGLLLRATLLHYTTTFSFASSETGTIANRPRLVVTYYLPAGAPPAPSLVIGHTTDIHVGGLAEAGLVASTLQSVSQQAQVLVDTGDCTEDGTDAQSIAFWELVAANTTIPWRVTPGNHDVPVTFAAYIGPMEWSYDVGGYRLIGIDFEDIDYTTLDQALTTEKICIVFGHIPLSYYSPENQAALRRRFDDYDVPLYVAGHTHQDSLTTDPETGTQLLVGHSGSFGSYRIITMQDSTVSVAFH
jgi:hypothetical protein